MEDVLEAGLVVAPTLTLQDEHALRAVRRDEAVHRVVDLFQSSMETFSFDLKIRHEVSRFLTQESNNCTMSWNIKGKLGPKYFPSLASEAAALVEAAEELLGAITVLGVLEGADPRLHEVGEVLGLLLPPARVAVGLRQPM